MVDISERFDGLQFDDDLIADNEIQPIAADFHAFEPDQDHSLSFIRQITISQGYAHGILICRFREAWLLLEGFRETVQFIALAAHDNKDVPPLLEGAAWDAKRCAQ